ncbi:MAG: ArsR family transcriptional regulator [Methanoregula sp.]|jgi:predicted transcriptional regulator|nr:ArsR family transcriptional regulator [Methanoregula sp.]
MRQKEVWFFTDKEEETISILIEIGMTTNVAKIFVYFSRNPDGTSREIELGTDLRQSDVSMAMKYFINRGWIKILECFPGGTGRSIKVFRLALPVEKILDAIETEKENELELRLLQLERIKHYF